MRTLLILFLSFPFWVWGQDKEKLKALWLEKAMENQLGQYDPNELDELISEFLNDPILINKANKNNLNRLYFLSEALKDSLLQHRKKYGNYLSKYELQAVNGIDAETARLLSELVALEEHRQVDQLKLKNLLKIGEQEWVESSGFSKPLPIGFTNQPVFTGSPTHLAFRYRANFGNRLYLGMALEKDPGETWGRLGDFQSYHLFYKGNGMLKTLALGDFQGNFGKGLNWGSAGYGGKSSMPLQTQVRREGFRPYRSLGEYGFMRGIGIELGKGSWNLHVWLSASPLTAKIGSDSLTQTEEPESISKNGLHRTSTELERKNTSFELTKGLHGKKNFKNGEFGWVWIQNGNELARPINLERLKEMAWQSEKTWGGAYGSFRLKNMLLGSECSFQKDWQKALLFSALVPIHSKLDLLFIGRHYDPAFQNSWSNAFSAYSSVGNEQGLYSACIFQANRKLKGSLYLDLFHSPKARYLASLPSKGSEWMLNIIYALSKTKEISLRLSEIILEKDLPSDFGITQKLGLEKKQNIRLQISAEITPNLSYRFRTEASWCQKSSGILASGFLVYHDFNWRSSSKKWSIQGRIQWFETDYYLARIYALERDLTYQYSNFMANGKGFHGYFIASYKISKRLIIEAKVARTRQAEVNQMGSGLNKVNGNQQSDFKIQLRYKLN